MMKVSCVMPTKDRRPFIKAAIECFERQTYQNRELVIVDDGSDPIEDIVREFDDDRIRYYRERRPVMTTGKKRNVVNSYASGTLICHFDDDDWSADDRIEFQVKLLEEKQKSMTGFSQLLFWDTVGKHALFYRSPTKGYVVGTSFLYFKKLWEGHPFLDKQVATDNDFVYPILNRVAASSDFNHMVARIHGNHTSGKENIRQVVSREAIPEEFWANEELRIS